MSSRVSRLDRRWEQAWQKARGSTNDSRPEGGGTVVLRDVRRLWPPSIEGRAGPDTDLDRLRGAGAGGSTRPGPAARRRRPDRQEATPVVGDNAALPAPPTCER
jgi:hypothetical protein